MTGAGRAAYYSMAKVIFNGELTINEGLASLIKGCDEIEAFYELKGEKASDIFEIRNILHKTYNRIHNLVYR
jgi:hypothetical protein